MKKVMPLILIFIIISSIFSGCNKQNTTVTEPVKTIDPMEQKKTELQKKILEGNYTADLESERSLQEWIRMWIDNIYSDYGITDIRIEYLSSATFSQFSSSFEIRPALYSVQFSSQSPIPGTKKNPDGLNALKVFVVSVMEGSKLVLSGFLESSEFNEYDDANIRSVYDVVSKDPRYSQSLKPFPTTSLPKEFTQLDMNSIAEGKNIVEMIALSNDIFAVICSSPIEGTMLSEISVLLYDSLNKKTSEAMEIGKYNYVDSWAEKGRLVIKTQKPDDVTESDVYYIDSVGSISSEKGSIETGNKLYSPDGRRYAYSDKGSIYAVEINNSNKPKLLLKGNPTDEVEGSYSYYPFGWTDDSTLIYGIMGYEWSYGCGMVDVTTGKDTFFEQAGRFAQPYSLADGKLFTIVGTAGEPFDPGVLDLKDSSYPWRKVFKDKSFIQAANTENYSLGYAFSPDGTKIALLKTSYDPYDKNILYICSAEDGSIQKSYEFKSGFSLPQSMEFLGDGRIAIYSQRYAYGAVYNYIVKLE